MISTLSDFNLEAADAPALNNRLREILTAIGPANYADVDPSVLHELALVSRALRRKNAGPPKAPKRASKATESKATESDLDAL